MKPGRDRRRWLASIALALCLDAAGLGLAGFVLGSWRQAVHGVMQGASGVSASLRVRLGPVAPPAATPRAPARPASPEAMPPVVQKAAPRITPEVQAAASAATGLAGQTDPAGESSLSGSSTGSSALAGDTAMGTELAATGTELAATGTPGTELTATGTELAATQAELLGRVDRLIRVNLAYPPLARSRNIQGEVRVSLLIGTDGGLADSSMVSGSGSSILDKAAISLLRKIFPLELDHELAEPVSLVVRIVYSLTS